MGSVAKRYEALSAELARVAEAAGRGSDEVRLVSVSKTASLEQVQEAFAAGARIFGENRIEVMMPKALALPEASWHFIGNVQSRKIKDIVAHADLIHSVWQSHHLPLINDAAAALGKVQNILAEVNVSGEESKDGMRPEDLPSFVEQCEGFNHLQVCGLMCMAPRGDMEVVKATFEGLARLKDDLIAQKPQRAATLVELSMGMSEDWPLAVRAGSTMVRVGRAIFSDDF